MIKLHLISLILFLFLKLMNYFGMGEQGLCMLSSCCNNNGACLHWCSHETVDFCPPLLCELKSFCFSLHSFSPSRKNKSQKWFACCHNILVGCTWAWANKMRGTVLLSPHKSIIIHLQPDFFTPHLIFLEIFGSHPENNSSLHWTDMWIN